MEITKRVTSLQNPLIKQVLLLKEKSRQRKKMGKFVIEGFRELMLAQSSGYIIEHILVCPEILQTDSDLPKRQDTIEISKKVYEKLAHRGSTEGILAIADVKDHSIDALKLSNNPLVLVAEAIEKPGNIGALLRTADAANLDAVLIANSKTDLYNPNVVRSSVGCVFTNQIAMASSQEIIAFLNKNTISIYSAALSASKNYVDCDFKKSTALVVGTEATGLSQLWLDNSFQNIIIPMQGQIDSMNVSVSAAILIFEAKRQRGF